MKEDQAPSLTSPGTVGLVKGAADGLSLGAVLGATVGATEGAADGLTLGAVLGATVGAPDGLLLGTSVGDVVGRVGLDEGWPVGA